MAKHQQTLNPSESQLQTTHALWSTSPVLLGNYRCSYTPLELRNVLPDSARAISDAPENTCSCGGSFRILWYLTDRILNCRSRWDVGTSWWETKRVVQTSAQPRIRYYTWWCDLTAVVVMVPWLHGISFIILIFVIVTRFVASWNVMFYLPKPLNIYSYSQSGYRGYSSIMRGAPGDSNW